MKQLSAYKFIKYFSLISLLLLFVLFSTSCGESSNNAAPATEAPANNSSSPDTDDFVKGEVLVRYKASAFSSSKLGYLSATMSDQVLPKKLISDGVVSVEAVFPTSLSIANAFATNSLNGNEVDKLNRWRLLKLTAGESVLDVVQRLSLDPEIEVVTANTLQQPSVFPQTDPDDLFFPLMYGLQNTGQLVPNDDSGLPISRIIPDPGPDPAFFGTGSAGADIDAMFAWQKTNGGDCKGIVIGVIDTGIDYRHADLVNNLWVNPGEIAGNNLDDDGNGYVDDVYGYDFYDHDPDPMDENGHGTHVAGTIAAEGNNTIGTTGVCTKNAKLMALRFIGGAGGPSNAAAEAIYYAANNGVMISNNSWGGLQPSPIISDAIEYALTNVNNSDPNNINPGANKTKMLMIFAAGNDNINMDTHIAKPSQFLSYPAALTYPNLISVGASDQRDSLAHFSNYGIDGVDLMAPGIFIPSTYADLDNELIDHWLLLRGTSMAAPHVTGVAALTLANDASLIPFEPRKLKARLMAAAEPADNLAGLALTEGRINANWAVDCSTFVTQPIARVNIEENFTVFSGEGGQIFKAHVFDCQDYIVDASVTLSFDNGEADVILWDDATHGDDHAGDGVYTNNWDPNTVGNLILTVTVTTGAQTLTTTSRSGRINRHHYVMQDIPNQWIAPDIINGAQLHPQSSINFNDGLTLTLPAGFSFPFYGVPYSEVTVSRFGYLTFGGKTGVSNKFTNTSLPDISDPNNMIAVFWDDMWAGAGAGGTTTELYSQVTGTAPNRTFTITWLNELVTVGTNTASFQVSLNEGTSDIIMRYLDIDYTTSPGNKFNYAANATVGVEDAYGVDATLALYNPFGIVVTEKLKDNSAIRFYPIGIPDGNTAPTAIITAPPQVYTQTPAVFDASASTDVDGDPLTYIWEMGDGTRLSGVSVTHTYNAAGPQTVTLIVHDGIQYSASTFTTFNVVAGIPDIVIDSVSVTPAPVNTGESFSLTAAISNIGTGSGFGFVRFSIVNVLTNTSTLIGNLGKAAIGGGPSVNVELLNQIVPVNLVTGSYVVRAVVGTKSKDSAPFNVSVGPDLEIITINGPGNFSAGAKVSYTVQIKNNGLGTVRNVPFNIYLSNSPTTMSTDVPAIFGMKVPQLGPGEIYTRSLSVTTSSTLVGPRYWAGVVDPVSSSKPDGLIAETNENNNVFINSKVITIGGINTKPVASFVGGPLFVGSGSVFDASASSDIDGDPILQYKWTINGVPSAPLNSPIYNPRINTAGSYTVILVVNDGIIDSDPTPPQTFLIDYQLDLELTSLVLDKMNATTPVPVYSLGENMQITFTVTNLSPVDSANFYYEVELINATGTPVGKYPLNRIVPGILATKSQEFYAQFKLTYPASIIDLAPDPVTGKILYFAKLLINGSDARNYPPGEQFGTAIGECPACRANNRGVLQFEINTDYDLIATQPSLSASIVPEGFRLAMTANTTNIGTSQTTAASKMRFELHRITPTGKVFDRQLGFNTNIAVLPGAGFKQSVVQQVTLFGIPVGDYVVYAVADFFNDVKSETDETNNRSPGAPLTIVVPSIDFSITDIVTTQIAAQPLATKAFNPVIGVPEQGFLSIATTVANLGTTKLPYNGNAPVVVTLSLVDSVGGVVKVLDTWNTPDVNPVNVPGLGLVQPRLEGGRSDTHITSFQLDATVLAGNYKLVATIDPGLQWGEADETNNTASVDLNLVPSSPDLVALHISSSTFFVPQGASTRINTRVYNQGSTATSSFFNLGVYLSGPNVTDKLIGFTSVNGLLANEQKEASFDLSIPALIPAGCYTLKLIVDYTNRVAECATCKVNNTLIGNQIAVNGAQCTILPIANAGGPYGGDMIIPVTFDGTGSVDPNNGVLTYLWDFGDNSPTKTGTGVAPSHLYTAAGVYNVSLVVNNGTNSSVVSPTVVNIVPAATAFTITPIANKTITAGQSLTFAVNAAPVPVGLTMSSSTVATTTFFDNGNGGGQFTWTPTNLDVGTHTVTFSATDGTAPPAMVTVSITVNSAPLPLVANAGGPYSGNVGSSIIFDASGTQLSDATLPVTYSWVFSDDPIGVRNGQQVSRTFTTVGTYQATLTVTNGTDANTAAPVDIVITDAGIFFAAIGNQVIIASRTQRFTVRATPAPVTLTMSSATITTATLVPQQASGTQGGIADFSWTTTSADIGTHIVTFTATNAAGNSVSTNVSISVFPQTISNGGGPYTAKVTDNILFDASASQLSSPTDPVTYTWTFSDGVTMTGVQVNKSFATSGNYTVTLTVANFGTSSSDGPISILINEANPVFSALAPTMSINENINVDFNVTATAPNFTSLITMTGAPFGSRFTSTIQPDGSRVGRFFWNTTFQDAGVYNLTFTVRHGTLISSVSTILTINDVYRKPISIYKITGTRAVGFPLTFDASGSYAYETPGIQSYTWDFGDGTPIITSTVPVVIHTYTTAAPLLQDAFRPGLIVNDGAVDSDPKIGSVRIFATAFVDINLFIDRFFNFPDLLPNDPIPAVSGQPLTLSVQIGNRGPLTTVSSPGIEVYFSQTIVFNPLYADFNTRYIKAIPTFDLRFRPVVGNDFDWNVYQTTFTIPTSLVAGNWYVFFVTNRLNVETEIDSPFTYDDNNIFREIISIAP